MVRYILSDMDGTLLNEQKEVPKGLGKMLKYLKAQHINFGVASGRQYYNLKKRLSAFGNDYLYICENGSIVFQGETCIYVDEISPRSYIKTIQHVRKATTIYPVLCGVEGAYIEHRDEEFVQNCHEYYERLFLVDDIIEAGKHDRICKIAIYDKDHTQTNAYPYMEGHYEGLYGVLSGEHWMDITMPDVNKGKAIRYIKEHEHVTSDDFMAFGDYMNDYEMLKECSYSYAMNNAHPEIKKISKYQAQSNEADGVMKALCEYFHLSYEDFK